MSAICLFGTNGAVEQTDSSSAVTQT